MKTKAEHLRGLLDDTGAVILRSKADRWISLFNDEQLDDLTEVLVKHPDMPYYEQDFLRNILYTLGFKEHSIAGLYETLVLHHNFITPIVKKSYQYNFSHPQQIVVGLRDHPMRSLDLSTPEKRRDLGALAAFGFELSNSSRKYLRTHKHDDIFYLKYADQRLKDLVVQHADRVELLMEYAWKRTDNIELLEALMNEENVTALNDGVL